LLFSCLIPFSPIATSTVIVVGISYTTFFWCRHDTKKLKTACLTQIAEHAAVMAYFANGMPPLHALPYLLALVATQQQLSNDDHCFSGIAKRISRSCLVSIDIFSAARKYRLPSVTFTSCKAGVAAATLTSFYFQFDHD
jgi:hypothetical protein